MSAIIYKNMTVPSIIPTVGASHCKYKYCSVFLQQKRTIFYYNIIKKMQLLFIYPQKQKIVTCHIQYSHSRPSALPTPPNGKNAI